MSILLTAVLAFVSTNIDDLFILTLFFGDQSRIQRDVVLGQLLGIATLITISLIGSFIGLLIDLRYVGLLGLLPCYLGIKGFVSLWKNSHDPKNGDIKEVPTNNSIPAVAAVTIANGGDNIGIYIPLFATMTGAEKSVTTFVFLMMTLVWCIIARYLARHPWLKEPLDKYGHRITPVVLFLLGIFILFESHSLSLFIH